MGQEEEIMISRQDLRTASRMRLPVSIICICLCVLIAYIDAQGALRRNGKIAFTSDRDGNLEIYVMNSDGTNQVRLTNNTLLDAHPSWSPDGRKIAFLSQRPAGGYAIFQMNADGTNKSEITPVSYQPPSFPYAWGWAISWSPDGRQLAFQDGTGISIVNNDGSGRRVLADGFGPAWAPDGSKILFIRGAFPWTLHTLRPDGTDLRTLPSLPNNYIWYYDATWSPAGNELAITAFDGANEVIFLTNADGTNPRETVAQCALAIGCSRLANVDWSPDGQTLIYFLLSSGELQTYDVDDGGTRQITNTPGFNSHPSWQALPRAAWDFDSDGRSDVSVFRPSDSTWYLNRSTAGFTAAQFGLATDRIVPADFDNDGKTDIAVYRDGTWWWINSSTLTIGVVQFGLTGDIPVLADFSGDGRDEIAVYRNGQWWMLDLASGQVSVVIFGIAADKPVVADYDGDGRADQAVYRDGEWHLNRSALGYAVITFGLPTDCPVVGDYDGDGKTDPALYRNGTWYLLQSTLGFAAFPWGLSTDIPTPGDYDGDGKTDAAIFRSGTWFINRSTSGPMITGFGLASDTPVPSAYMR
jgi:dipeptidyl aminopeptidase/acylaminoacyl peptidase